MNGGAWRHISKDEYDHLKARGETGLDWIEGVGYVVYDRQAFEEFRSASDRIAASARERASAAVVKPLEWDAHGRADVYSVVKDNLRSPPDFFMARGNKIIGHYSDETEAKAAAQADYGARIKSALVEVPAVKGEPEPVAWRWRIAGQQVWQITKHKPVRREGTPCVEQVDIEPLYTAPPAGAGVRKALAYAERLAIVLWSKHFKDIAPHWKPLTGDLIGLLTQIDNMTTALTAPGATMKSDEPLGRFGHHPIPADDFLVEVECIENEWSNIKVGFTNGTPTRDELEQRLFRAMQFRVGDDAACVDAKAALRKVEAEMRSTSDPSSTPSEVTVACGLDRPSESQCPNMKEVGGGMDGERYSCAVCGKGYYLDYDDMR